MKRFVAASLLALLGGCHGEIVPAGDSMGDGGGQDSGGASRPDLASAGAVDDATIVSSTLPTMLECGTSFAAQVTVHNAGNTTWTRADGYKLGAVGDSDPFYGPDARVWLPDGVTVAPGGDYTFMIPMTAPAQADNYVTDWQMVREGVRWFGATTSQNVAVSCFDLSMATIMNSPADVATWSATAMITLLDLQASGAHIDFTKRDGPGSWPDVPFGMPGDSLEYTLWIVLNINGQWYASGCIEYWRGLDRNGGPPSQYAMNWYYDPIRWGPMVGHQPAVGEQVGFLVTAGDARNNGNTLVKERSNVVFVPFPSDAGGTFNF